MAETTLQTTETPAAPALAHDEVGLLAPLYPLPGSSWSRAAAPGFATPAAASTSTS